MSYLPQQRTLRWERDKRRRGSGVRFQDKSIDTAGIYGLLYLGGGTYKDVSSGAFISGIDSGDEGKGMMFTCTVGHRSDGRLEVFTRRPPRQLGE